MDLDADERGGEVRALVHRIDFTAVGKSTPQPDRFVYEFGLGDREFTVQEQQMTDELRRLAGLVLGDGRPGPVKGGRGLVKIRSHSTLTLSLCRRIR